jgi:hypothetical protein
MEKPARWNSESFARIEFTVLSEGEEDIYIYDYCKILPTINNSFHFVLEVNYQQ